MLNRFIFNRISACLYLLMMLAVPHLASAQADDIRIDVLGTCIPQDPSTGNASTKFFAHYEQTPDSVLWDFGIPPDPADTTGTSADSLKSRQLHPIFMFQEEGSYRVQLLMWTNGVADTVIHTVDIRQNENELQIMDTEEEQPVSGEVVLCGDKVLEAQLSGGGDQGGGGGSGGGNENPPVEVTWYKPHSTMSPNPEISETITLTMEQDADGRYRDAGTYYAVYDDGSGCKLTQSFRVVIWNESTQRSSRWYFGNGAGIDFQTNEPIQTLLMRDGNQATEGNSMIGDENADVLFFSNGETVWYGSAHNGSEELAAGGSGLAGSKDVAQNSLFVKFPQIESLFYLFTINNNRQLSLTTLDLIADPPPPGVALSETEPTLGQPVKNILVHQPVAEKITSTGRTDGGYWVVAHELGSDNFLSYPVTTEGIGMPTVSATGTVYGNSDEDATGYMRISEGGDILATAVNQGTSKFIELFRFDADSGLVSDPVQIQIDESNGTLYGLELTDSLIYATVTSPGGPSYLYQYKYDSTLDIAAIQESEQMTETNDELGAVQMGPDGQIYIASNGKQYVYRIPNIQFTENFQLGSSYEFALWERTNSTLGLPNFGANAGTAVPDAQLTVTPPYCFGDDVEVSGTQRYSTDILITFEYFKDSPTGSPFYTDPVSLQQQQGPGGGSGAPQQGGQGATSTLPFDRYESLGPGTYYVRMTIENPCGTYPDPALGQEEIIEEFTISARPEARLKSDETLELCDNQSVTFVGAAVVDGQEVNPTEASFFWLDALDNDLLFATGPELTVSEAGVWKLFVVSNNGCPSDTLQVEAIDLRPEADLGDDIGICQGEDLPQQDVSVAVTNPQDFNYAWFLSIDGGSREDLDNNSVRQPLTDVDTERPGTYQYIVEITAADEDTECFKSDTIQVVVTAQPIVRITASENNCNGTAVLTAEVEGGTDASDISYRWVGPGIASGQGTNQITINDSGEYTVEIEDSFTQCTAQSEPLDIDLFNPLGNLRIEAEAACVAEGSDYVPNTINLISSYSGNDISIEWFELAGIGQYQAIDAYRDQLSIEVDDGTYRAIVSLNNPNCATVRDTAEIEVTRTVLPQAQLQQVYVLCPTFPEMRSETLTVSGFNRYEWRNTTTGQVLSRSETITLTQEGFYELRVDNCDEPARFQVVYDCTPKLFLPNAIRVDGTNSVFRILNENMLANIQRFQIVIMNRWGEVIYQSNDPFFQWRGTDRNGKLVMPNTYVYIITYQNQFGEDQQTIQNQRGGITVLR